MGRARAVVLAGTLSVLALVGTAWAGTKAGMLAKIRIRIDPGVFLGRVEGGAAPGTWVATVRDEAAWARTAVRWNGRPGTGGSFCLRQGEAGHLFGEVNGAPEGRVVRLVNVVWNSPREGGVDAPRPGAEDRTLWASAELWEERSTPSPGSSSP
ncbi:hypothetical protein [Deferrisoma camini]|uniref:hypothetical protein n=1 Tax=Deferrisoma camini TaxID=1035120 RepID=UPI00146ECD89|nr:hypothetical protein [Deferrisoma camini]